MRPTHKCHRWVWFSGNRISMGVRPPLGLDRVLVPHRLILRGRIAGGGSHPVKTWRPLTGETVPSPVVVAEPMKRGGEAAVGNPPHSFAADLVVHKAGEQQIGSFVFDKLFQVAVHRLLPLSARVLEVV